MRTAEFNNFYSILNFLNNFMRVKKKAMAINLRGILHIQSIFKRLMGALEKSELDQITRIRTNRTNALYGQYVLADTADTG